LKFTINLSRNTKIYIQLKKISSYIKIKMDYFEIFGYFIMQIAESGIIYKYNEFFMLEYLLEKSKQWEKDINNIIKMVRHLYFKKIFPLNNQLLIMWRKKDRNKK